MSLGRVLHWEDAPGGVAADVKGGVMLDNSRFAALMEDIKDPALQQACGTIKNLVSGDYKSTCSSAQFVQVLQEANALARPITFTSPCQR